VIIGCGNRAKGHADGFQKAEGVELVAVADGERPRSDAYEDQYGVPAYYDAAEMLE